MTLVRQTSFAPGEHLLDLAVVPEEFHVEEVRYIGKREQRRSEPMGYAEVSPRQSAMRLQTCVADDAKQGIGDPARSED